MLKLTVGVVERRVVQPNVPKRHPAFASKHRYRASSGGREGAWGSFDDFVGAGEQRVRYRQAQRVCGLEVDGEFVFVRGLHG
jgi:hypothetical protein